MDIDFDELIIMISNERETKDFVLDVLRNQLFNEGVEGYDYSDVTVTIKKRKGQPSDRVTLLDKGDFYDSFTIEATRDAFIIDADDEKNGNNLFDKYDEEKVITFNEESLSEIREFYENRLVEELKIELLKIFN
jgi:hypothetical protein